MHLFPYEMKRAHWRMTWWGIHLFRRRAKKWKRPELKEMTPARFDIFYAMKKRPVWWRGSPGEIFQMSFGVLVQKLGLHPSTVSKCLARLVALGFLTRHRAKHDARIAIFRVTALGAEAFRLANAALWGDSIEAFWEANAKFAGGAAWDPSRMAWCLREPIDSMLVGFGYRLRECATELGSLAWPIYDSDFDDPYLAVFATA